MAPSPEGVRVLAGVSLPERYQLVRRIARGGMASVWCARDRRLDRNVAIKLLAAPYAHDRRAVRRFTGEARAAAHLSGHANVVTIYDVGQAAAEEGALGRPFIVMEYLSGGTVADALRTGELNRDLILRWLRQAATALDYAHHRGVIHRDVKLSNFLLDRERVLHVGDFGIALLGTEDTLTSSRQVMGTAAYLAPECALGLPATDASDRYALAVAAFELLVGERPFTSQHFAVQARQHVEDRVPRASQRNEALPAALDAVLARGMAKHPDERFATAGQLVDAVQESLTHRRAKRRLAVPVPRQVVALAPLARPAAATADRSPAGRRAPTVYGRRDRGRLAALAALAAALVGVAAAAGATLLSGGPPRRAAARTKAAYALRSPKHPAMAAGDRTSSSTTSTARSTAPPVAHPTTTASAPPTPPPVTTGPMALEAKGHQLMLGGSYSAAIPVLRQAVATASPASLTYAYALYDLGRSLRLAGDPRAAVPVLWRRMQIPDQTDVVRQELALALEALGRAGTARQGGGPAANRSSTGPAGHASRGRGSHRHGGSGSGRSSGGAAAGSQGD